MPQVFAPPVKPAVGTKIPRKNVRYRKFKKDSENAVPFSPRFIVRKKDLKGKFNVEVNPKKIYQPKDEEDAEQMFAHRRAMDSLVAMKIAQDWAEHGNDHIRDSWRYARGYFKMRKPKPFWTERVINEVVEYVRGGVMRLWRMVKLFLTD